MSPQRIQLSRKRGWRLPEDAVNVARPSKWGNPFKVGSPYFVMDIAAWRRGQSLAEAEWRKLTAADAVACYERWLSEQVGTSGYAMTYEAQVELAGRDLACWCPLVDDKGQRVPCHADHLLSLANPGWTP